MSATNRPSFWRPSAFAFFLQLAIVLGWILLASAVVVVFTSNLRAAGTPLLMTAVLLVALELLPLVQGRGHDPQGVVMSTAFVAGMLFLWGIWPAVLVVSIAALVSDINVGKAPWKILFNVGQYNVSVAAGWLVMMAAGKTPSLEHPLSHFTGRDLLWMIAVWVVYFLTNDVLVSGVLAWTDSFAAVFLDDFWHYSAMTFSVLALSPLVVVMAQQASVLLPLLLVPLLLVYRTAQVSLDQEHQAGHDPLTDLPNRKNLLSTLDDALTKARRERSSFGLMLIDLDHFKEVNDTLGHHVGDQVLIHFAERLAGAVRDGDLVARLGGDEFAIIVDDADAETAYEVAERVRGAMTDPISLEGLLFDIEASIGIAIHPEHGDRADDLLRRADVAMYDAKANRSGIANYTPARDRNSPDRLGLLGELRQGLTDDSLTLVYQPKLSMLDGSLLGVEALIRWNHPVRGAVAPDEFIPLAERSGIMPQLTERVITVALDQLVAWRESGLIVQVAVNVSVTDLAGTRLIDLVRSGLQARSLPAAQLQLEITERVVAQETAELNEALAAFSAMGVTVSLDDFGTGYSSLLRLQSLPVDEIKIDRAFVAGLVGTDGGPGIVQAVIELAHALGLPAIAEGVETEQEWNTLRALGCDGGQGWFVARPMTPDVAGAWLHERLASPRSTVSPITKNQRAS
ncbi:EAL domain-containing protein [Jatrophihabitans telluris]|uniref:EAL domain-containing protein n=1 Tax=Jatrophihabitans telluris TaxID=2038343 RepID=A0ABY4QW49_9ACTN|nr:EAL domain-containing protein [Jatrophihabitans telluris]UQX87896.1 EAL domain-containing protein [Jatrophihabitans telluris]